MRRVEQIISDDTTEKETLAMMKPGKLLKKKVDISDEVRKKKFVFNSRGKLTKKELVELKKTNSNIFAWVAKEQSKLVEKSKFEEKVKDVDMDTAEEPALEREERLQRVAIRQ